MTYHTMPLVQADPWLEPVARAVSERYERFRSRKQNIESLYGSLRSFASADNLFGLNYDLTRKGWWYREWAPAASALFLTGDFNNWNPYDHPLINNGRGIWEIFLPDKEYHTKFVHSSKFKVLVQSQLGENERIPAYIKRVVQDEHSKDFSAQVWTPASPYSFTYNSPVINPDEPLLIYEAHIGMAQEKAGVGSYKEFQKNILNRIIQAGYNAIQLMAIAEHPYYGSFGYHVSNFFAPSSRFGTPEELKELIDEAHRQGLIVIMDIVHSHTVKNTREGVNLFDGTDFQYTHSGARGDHPQWDSKLFNYGKDEVLQFLLSNLRYWMEEFRFDGFRFDGVTSMMYFHHGQDVVFDRPEKYFLDGVEYDAITYLQLANTLIHELNPHAITIAEDVSGMPGLCHPIKDGGIGFDYRLGMGLPDFWIKYISDMPDEQWNMEQMFHAMTNRLFDVKTIAYVESHDQALVGDKTIAFRLMDKEMYTAMDKDYESLIIDRGIALHKMVRFFTLVLGGEAWMNFMGNEFGHPEWVDFPREGNRWSYQHARRQWSLADKDYLKYHWLADFDKAMLEFVKKYHILTALPPWKLKTDEDAKTIVFERNNLIFVFNWHANQTLPDYEIPLRESGEYILVFSSDESGFGGYARIDKQTIYHSYLTDSQPVMKIYNINRAVMVFRKINA